MAAAFEGGRCFLDPGRGHDAARHRGEPGRLQLVLSGREGGRADMHRLGDRMRDDIDGEDFRQADVAGGVLERHVGMVLDPERQDRRIGRQAVEEAEGRRIDAPFRIDRRDQRDRPRHHGPDHQLVAVARR